MRETERLKLLPLTGEQLEWLVESIEKFEKKMSVRYEAEPVDGWYRNIIKGQIEKIKKEEENYLYYTFWMILRKEDRVIIGSADFKCPPNEKGEVEIGYGLGENYRKKGYMVETVNELCQWALEQKEVQCVLAETEKWNIDSQKVLQHCDFQLFKEEETLWWKKVIS